MKKAVALGVAGAAAVVIAGWRRIQRDNALEGDPLGDPATAWQAGGPGPAGTSSPEPAKPSPAGTASVSEKSSKAELYEVAQALDVEGRSKMTKAELLAAIRRAS